MKPTFKNATAIYNSQYASNKISSKNQKSQSNQSTSGETTLPSKYLQTIMPASAPARPTSADVGKKYKSALMPHEKALLSNGLIRNATHKNASALRLSAPKMNDLNDTFTRVYRPMGDREIQHLMTTNQLPSTQPYQAIIEGDNGCAYAMKYLNGLKRTDTHPSTVVEFHVPKTLVKTLFDRQHKVEDGALSMGLGNKAGKGLDLFNESLRDDGTGFRIVGVKRKV